MLSTWLTLSFSTRRSVSINFPPNDRSPRFESIEENQVSRPIQHLKCPARPTTILLYNIIPRLLRNITPPPSPPPPLPPLLNPPPRLCPPLFAITTHPVSINHGRSSHAFPSQPPLFLSADQETFSYQKKKRTQERITTIRLFSEMGNLFKRTCHAVR